MKLRNLMRTTLSFNLSDGTPVHLASREEMAGLDDEVADDPQVIRRVRRGYLRVFSEKTRASEKKEQAPKPTSKGKKKTSTRGESQGANARGHDGEEGKASE